MTEFKLAVGTLTGLQLLNKNKNVRQAKLRRAVVQNA
jgi:hypothetical protein